MNQIKFNRRQFVKTLGISPVVTKTVAKTFAQTTTFGLLSGLGACATAPYHSKQSYLSQIISPENLNVVFHCVDIALQQTRDQRIAPPRAAYNFAMPLVAGFLAANSITQEYQEHYQIGEASVEADPQIAYAVAFLYAAAEVFQTPFAVEKRRFLAQYESGESKTLAVQVGKKIARKIIRQRNDDGAEPSEAHYYFDNYQRRNDVLGWKPTAPFYRAKPGPAYASFARGLFPSQGKIKPWTMTSGAQFRSTDFYDPASPEFAREFDLIKTLGGADSSIRTKQQSEIALFWEDGPWGITPPGHFLYIAMQFLQYKQQNFMQLAHSFALLGMSLCDACISSWDNKYHHDIIRPESAIRVRAEQFNNQDARVTRQANWASYIPTPEFPSYTSGHSTFGAAAMTLLTLINGSDKVSLSGRSPDLVLWPQLAGITRYWSSLSQIAEENGMSRLYGGVHWELDHKMAMQAGQGIAKHAFENIFKKKV